MKPKPLSDGFALGLAAVLTVSHAQAATSKPTLKKPAAKAVKKVVAAPVPASPAEPEAVTPVNPSNPEIEALRQKVKEQDSQIQLLTERLDKLEQAQKASPLPAAPAQTDNGEPPIPEPQVPGETPAAPAEPGTTTPGETSASPSTEPPIPEVSIPSETNSETPTVSASGARASFTPDISVIGNNVGRFISVKGDRDRNRLQLAEVELGLQQPIYQGIRFDAFIAGDAEEGFSMAAEEAYVTLSNVAGLPFGGYLGQKRLDFGKINPTHPHTRPYADQPAVVSNFLGPDGLSGNGASMNYTLPVKRIFANVELGMWKVDPLTDEGLTLEPAPGNPYFYPAGLGITNNFPLGRLWLSKELGNSGELELGTSGGFGKADNGDQIGLTGVDFTLRKFPSTFKRFMLQGEAMWHRREDRVGGTGSHIRNGEYLMLSYRPDQYREYGLRLDNSQYPWPIGGRDRSASLIWSNHLTEGTLIRVQLKHGSRTNDVFLPASNGYNDVYLQFIWAAGAHTHPLQ
jgi:hypothetical protein